MVGVRLLGVATAYSIVLLEVYSGAINGPDWWIYPGALVIALLLSMSLFGMNEANSSSQQTGLIATAVQWILVIALSFAMAYFANYFGRIFLPSLVAG